MIKKLKNKGVIRGWMLSILLFLTSFVHRDTCAICKWENTHWYGADVFDVFLESKNEMKFFYSPSCMLSFGIKKAKDGYIL